MDITNNLKNDILHAPDWFHQAIQDKPEDKIFEHKLGNVSYSKWATSSANKNLIVLLHGGSTRVYSHKPRPQVAALNVLLP